MGEREGRSYLVTGALGCIGAWVVRQLVDGGNRPVVFDIADDRSRLHLVCGEDRLAQVEFVQGDITSPADIERALDDYEVSRVIHLAGLLVPAARRNPPLAVAVNVGGTVNVFEAVLARRARIPNVVYASSAAVYDLSDGLRVAEELIGRPRNLYGVHKQAAEGTARVYWHEAGLPSVGLRPCIVYGPGRDAGASAGPTLAMRAAARGEGFEIPFGGRQQFHYAPDVAAAFIAATEPGREGAVAANIGGPVRPMSDMVAAIEAAAPEARGRITYRDEPLPNPEEMEAKAFPVSFTPLEVGVKATIDHFREYEDR